MTSLTKQYFANINRVRTDYSYDPETGILTNKHGKETGFVKSTGYAAVAPYLNGRQINVPVHRLAYFLMTGEDVPEGLEIDHINQNKLDNRWENIRVVTRTQNLRNRRFDNPTGYMGVKQYNQKFRGRLQFRINGKKVERTGPMRATAAEAYLDRVSFIAQFEQVNDRANELKEFLPKAAKELTV